MGFTVSIATPNKFISPPLELRLYSALPFKTNIIDYLELLHRLSIVYRPLVDCYRSFTDSENSFNQAEMKAVSIHQAD